MEHQLVVYAQSKNLDLAALNATQRAELKESMIADQYPGECSNDNSFLNTLRVLFYLFQD